MLRPAGGASALLTVRIGVGAFTDPPVTYLTILDVTRISDTGIPGGATEAFTQTPGGWDGAE